MAAKVDKERIYKVDDYNYVNFLLLDDESKEMILDKRNHYEIRKWMYNSETIDKKIHFNFIKNLKKRNDRLYWLVYKNDIPVGVVNVTDIDEDFMTGEGGYYLFPEILNSGIGLEFVMKFHYFVFKILGFESLRGAVYFKNIQARIIDEYIGCKIGNEKLILDGKIYIPLTLFREDFLNINDTYKLNDFIKFYKKRLKEIQS